MCQLFSLHLGRFRIPVVMLIICYSLNCKAHNSIGLAATYGSASALAYVVSGTLFNFTSFALFSFTCFAVGFLIRKQILLDTASI